MRQTLLFFFVILIAATANASQYSKISLNDDWQFKVVSCPTSAGQQLTGKTFKTSVPNNMFLDFQNQGIIQDPFIEDNHVKVKWVSECTLTYIKKFNVDQNTMKFNTKKIIFEGIDTYSSISINGQEIQVTKNAFVEYQIPVQQNIKLGQNIIEVTISSSSKHDNQGQRQNQMPFIYAHTRKACYQYGWDWAPTLISIGIWKPVYLQTFNKGKIGYVWVRNRMISNEKAIINFAVALQGQKWTTFGITSHRIVIKNDDKELASVRINDKNMYIDVQIDNPRLWWPNGIGIPYIYDFKVILLNQKNQSIHQQEVVYGIRDIKLNLEEKKFEVVVNGYPVYAKGANYVPADMFYPRLTNPRYKAANTIESIINDMVDSHFNMVRVWGGGQYESNQFLELCSRKGIMIFYDFMFSDSIYPSTQGFLQNVQLEIKQQVRRARNYPALAIWSGNNQILQGINDWGWGSSKYREDYKKLFETLIPKVIEYESPYVDYIPSSPIYGVGNYGLDRGGDTHFWSVWAGGSLFQTYEAGIGAFNSQFGTQALPVWQTITQFTKQDQRSYESPVFQSHEKHMSKFNTHNMYINNYGKKSLNFQLEAYQSGLIQAYGIEVAIKAQRCSKPKSMGTLYWQLNDAWPAISWSSIDYYGRWKPLQYMAKRIYQNVALLFFKNQIYAINDKLNQIKAIAIIKLLDFEGKALIDETMENITLKGNQIKKIMTFDFSKVQRKQKDVVLYTTIIAGKDQIMQNTHFFAKFGELNLPDATITVEFNQQFNCILISTDKFVKNLQIYNTKEYVKLSDNYFDLLPGNTAKIFLKSGKKLAELKQTMKFRSYRQVYVNEALKVIVKAE